MSGHSKWSQIKRKKQAKDQMRGDVFSKLSRLITLAVVAGGGIADPEHNVKLRLAVEKARAINMPKDNITRAIERGVGPDKHQLKEVIYEAFLHGGVALVIMGTTDNPNRTLSEVRNILERHGGKLGIQGSVMHYFDKCGLVIFNRQEAEEDRVYAFAQEIGAFDIDEDESSFYVYIPFEAIGRVRDATVEVDFKPKAPIRIENEAEARNVIAAVEALEESDDIHKVFGNYVL